MVIWDRMDAVERAFCAFIAYVIDPATAMHTDPFDELSDLPISYMKFVSFTNQTENMSLPIYKIYQVSFSVYAISNHYDKYMQAILAKTLSALMLNPHKEVQNTMEKNLKDMTKEEITTRLIMIQQQKNKYMT